MESSGGDENVGSPKRFDMGVLVLYIRTCGALSSKVT